MSSDPRTAILNSAGEVFARFGFKKASMEDIARRAGVGKGSLYLHFESKEELFEACLRLLSAQSIAEFEMAVRRAETPGAQIRAFIQCKLEQNSRMAHRERFQMETLFELGTQARRLLPEFQQKETALLERILAEGNAQGVMAVAAPHLVATGLVETLWAISGKLLTQDGTAALRAALDAYLDVFIRGLAPPRAAPPHPS
ncbi:TetR/AcrR family transcriptional regulator [Hyalangium rubrum]|uniref:Helix-turn-helix domain-containing protein n=1 Tax=Hyalangium rubrum TaxID=3103134 RepID=A0ABU5HLS1_9BACT|nr:helix-turn-helix domain-containing protein [Hyalangium sp. s54d21]MDY7233050.1 helix-turn-helix domain-containing protein [Hyalangium sp. s54d21]